VPPVSSPHPDDPIDSSAKTLGQVLYADSVEAPVPETDWTTLVRYIADGDQTALRELYERTHRIAFTLIFRIVHDRLTAEEVLLDVYHDVWRKAATFDPTRGTVIAWLMNQTRSRAIDRLRVEHSKKRTPSDESIDVAETPFDSFDSVLTRNRASLVESSLAALTPDERRAIEAAYFQELTCAEVAESLGEPIGTIKTRIRSGLAKLRALLAGKEVDL
jgi:RNA polymerase sigma-70 factor (ECF subfamily)